MNILENPFCVLGVSSRDNRRRISEAAEEKSFLGDSESVREAQNVLTIPGRRLTAEIRWFPGMDNEYIREIIEYFHRLEAGKNPGRINSSGVRSLALLNLAVSVFSFRKFRDVSAMKEDILLICRCFDAVSTEGVCAVINNDRLIAGFPQANENDVVRELNDYRADILGMIDGKLSALTQNEYSGLAVRLASKYSEGDGKSFLLGDILSSYELKILPQLEELAGIIIDTASDVKLSLTLREWRKLARPLIISAKAIGIENTNLRNQAEEIFYAVREKAVKLHNEHHKTREALKLILMLKESLADISARLSDMANNDIRELEKLEREKIQAEREYEDYKSSIYYETEFGLIFKDKFRISSEGISWKGINTPLEEVYGMKWGGIRKYVNGMYMRTDYKITLQTSYITVNLTPNEKKYNEIVPRLWRALAGSISAGILKQLQAGELLFFGGIKIKDNGVYLKKSGWFSSDVQFFTWRDHIITYSNNGMFIIKAGEYSASSSYINDMNTHILEAMLQNFLRNPTSKRLRLSSLLDSH